MIRLAPIWYPTRATLGVDHASMTWTDLSGISFDEPFFHQTVRRAGSRATCTLPIGMKPTPYSSADTAPAAFIFHVSRCGSTLLCNMFRSLGNGHVVAEAQAFTALLAPVGSADCKAVRLATQTQQRQTLLRQITSALGQSPDGQKAPYFIKCTSYSAMRLDLIRSVWPLVPIIFLTRDPLEVMVSNLNRPPGWIKAWKNANQAASLFGWSGNTDSLSQEEFLARSFGSICQAAQEHLGSPSLVLDYQDLTCHDGWYQVLKFLGCIAPDTAAQARLAAVLQTNAKARYANQSFRPDAQDKRSQASSLVYEAANRWAYPPLRALLAHHASAATSK